MWACARQQGQREQARVSLPAHTSGAYIPSKGGKKIPDTNPGDARRTELQERGGELSSAALRSAGANRIQTGGGVEKAATAAAQTAPPLGHPQISTTANFRDSLTPDVGKSKKKARSSNLHSRMTIILKSIQLVLKYWYDL